MSDDITWLNVSSPGRFQPYGMNSSAAERIWREVGHVMCNMGDVLVFSDTIPDARPVLQGGCRTPIILQVNCATSGGGAGPCWVAWPWMAMFLGNALRIE